VSEPLFSIIIACYNHENFIREAVESALRQPDSSKEIIVVDDASKDRSAEVLQSFGSSIVFESLPVNRGAAAGRNHGASVAKGRYLVFLDGDDVLTPWTLKVYGRIIEKHSPKLILGRSFLFSGDPPATTAGPQSSIRFVDYPTFFDKDRPWVYNTSSLVVERAAFRDAGGWSEDIFYQDIQDLLNKMSVAGRTSLVLAPETVFYRMHATNAVRKVAPFIEGVSRLLAKARQGAYPGDRRVRMKRAVWFGGLIFYWGKQGMRNGLFLDGLRLLFTHWWMVFLALIRRGVAWIVGRKPVEVLTLEPSAPENTVASHPRIVTEHS
jgi:glycosyltransferase involved in cell wall biosynthesis